MNIRQSKINIYNYHFQLFIIIIINRLYYYSTTVMVTPLYHEQKSLLPIIPRCCYIRLELNHLPLKVFLHENM